jgi:hypothetical protein
MTSRSTRSRLTFSISTAYSQHQRFPVANGRGSADAG